MVSSRWVTSALACLLLIQAKASALPNSADLVDYVNILQGTDSAPHFSHGNTLPLVGMPWGMVNWSMQNDRTGWFFHPNGKIDGFRATHEPSPWMGDWGEFVLMPQSGGLKMDPDDRTVDYDATTAVLHPDYEKLDLNHGAITAELTGSERCGVFRLNFHQSTSGRLILDTCGGSDLKVEGRTIYGISRASSGGVVKKTFASYFVVQLDRDITKSEIIRSAGSAPSPAPALPPNATPAIPPKKPSSPKRELDGYVEFNTSANDPVLVRVGTSFISWQQAEQNLRAEAEGNFDAVHSRVSAVWNVNLGKIEIEADEANKATFYSCLYRAQMFPHRLYEIAASGKPIHYSPYDGKVHDGVLYGDIGIWDAFRTTFPFLALVYPAQLADILQGFVNASVEGNGTLPEWPSPGYRRCMIGQHCAAIFADACVKGIPGFDLATAYESLRKSAFEEPPKGALVRDGMADYLRLGYLPEPARYSVSTSLDYAYDDWCVAQIARKLNHPEVAQPLMARAQNYRKLWDPAVGFMRGKKLDGSWAEPFDEFTWQGPYAESGPWQASWFVPHDPSGLAGLLGGREPFAAKLDKLFSLSLPPGHKTAIHEEAEMAAIPFGQCALDNQPSFSIPYLYAVLGYPWKTQCWTRRACAELFHATPEGFCGDEDNGSMASWYLLSSLGLYSFCPGTTQYIVTSPMFAKATLKLANGKTLVIEAAGNSDKNIYIQSRSFNGVEDARTWMDYQDIMKGGGLHFQMVPQAKTTDVPVSGLPYSASTEN
jgi:predicted alpha-1,2-mannosidase